MYEYLCCFHQNQKDLELTLQISNGSLIITLTSNFILIVVSFAIQGFIKFSSSGLSERFSTTGVVYQHFK